MGIEVVGLVVTGVGAGEVAESFGVVAVQALRTDRTPIVTKILGTVAFLISLLYKSSCVKWDKAKRQGGDAVKHPVPQHKV
jgi:hypothetical protein